ncbi:MAG: DUF1841 family protein [Tatlockia sp.]|nr:DUF1841 family protein [Tatlockia sp.]
MFYGDKVQDTRQMFFASWQKFRQKQAMQPLEQQLVAVIKDHPEYHALLENPAGPRDHTYYPELGQTNPFLHMGLHLAIRDQLSTDRPVGVLAIYKTLLQKYTDPLLVEHLMMDCFAECLWQAQRNKHAPDEKNYLAALSELGLRD